MRNMKKISTIHLVLLSTGGMIGAGWLFSPYYGFQVAGVGVLISWVLTAILTLIIGFSFAEVSTMFPVVGGVMRFMGVSHNRTLGFLFLVLGWVSYIVYLPLEAQSAIQYLGFWIPALIKQGANGASLSIFGLLLALLLMIFLTWFNTMYLSKVSKTNTVVGFWKIGIPLILAIGMIIFYGKSTHINMHLIAHPLSFEPILLAITSSGLAFAFSGFQNGLIVANSALDPKKAIPWSLFAPVVIGLLMYGALSLMFISCLPNNQIHLVGTAAPLLGLLSLFGLHYVYVILFVDAIVAPMGTANVFTAVTGRILFSIGKEFFPHTQLTALNKSHSPYIALWINAFFGACFLLPFPTWTQLVNFLSSLTLLSCLSGPIALMIFRDQFPQLKRSFKSPCYQLISYAGFSSCGLFVYWSGYNNLFYLIWLIVIISIIYGLLLPIKNFFKVIQDMWYLLGYIIILYLISDAHHRLYLLFPYDNLLVILLSLIFAKIFFVQRGDLTYIGANVKRLQAEIAQNE